MSSRPRKRDILKDLWRGSSPRAPVRTSRPDPNTAPTQKQPASTIPSQKFFEEALLALTPEEQFIIQDNLPKDTRDILPAVDGAYNAAVLHKQVCEDRQWRWTFRGREIVLQKEADKIFSWLERFKSTGDVIANVDPLHAGLPWAGIRVILEMTTSERHQMAALLIGMSLTIDMINRLKVYLRYFAQLPPALATTEFEKALIKTYARLLQFIAAAIQTYQRSRAARTWRALWEISSLEAFEKEVDKLGSGTEIAANNCDRALRAQKWASLETKLDLTKLRTVQGATYNSHADAEGDLVYCLEGTRSELLLQIANWFDDPKGKPVFWLCGMAGTGKSTISRTVARDMNERQRLGASFFFKRGEGDRGNASRFFPTIARQLADRFPGLDQFIAKALEANFFLCGGDLRDQFEKLILQPLLGIEQKPVPPGSFAIVIDALDECERGYDVKKMLNLLSQLSTVTTLNLRIFVTSRPELPIQLGFRKMDGALHEDVYLEEVQAASIRRDIDAFFKFRFKETRENWEVLAYDPLPPDWPGDDKVQTLVDLAVPLFIFAFTVCRYISESQPQKRLDIFLDQRHYKSFAGLNATYLPILNQQLLDRDEQEHEQIIEEFQQLVGPIVLLADPLSASSLSRLLDISLQDISERLKHLNSVLNIPRDRTLPIRLLHLSFRDFLVNSTVKHINRFWINEIQMHKQLADMCLRRLNQPRVMKQDLLGLKQPGVKRAEIEKHQIDQCIPFDVQYACSYWVWHLKESEDLIRDNGQVHQFLKFHLLHWLEALSWVGRISNAIGYISSLLSITEPGIKAEIAALLDDAQRFVLRNRQVIDLAPLQLYHSAMVFAPSQSITRSLFQEECHTAFRHLPWVATNWSSEIQKLEGHEDIVTSAAVSPDGQIIASASNDQTLRMWDAKTGEETQIFEASDHMIIVVAFSPTEHTIATGASDGTIRLRNVATIVEEVGRLVGHEEQVSTVSFSSNGRLIVSGSDDCSVRLWNLDTGRAFQKFTLHSEWINSATFSPNGELIVSCDNNSVEVWNIEGRRLQSCDEEAVAAVAFSPDGQTIAMACIDNTILLWNIATQSENRLKLNGHTARVTTIAFSPDGKMIASGSADRTVILWSTTTTKLFKLRGHTGQISALDFSTNSQMLISASDKTVWLWSTAVHEETEDHEGHHESLVKALAFSPSGHIIASGSSDFTIQLRSVSTGKVLRTLQGHHYSVNLLAFASEEVIASSDTLNVRLWDVTTGEQMQVIEDVRSASWLAFTPDGRSLATDNGTFALDEPIPLTALTVAKVSMPVAKLEVLGHWIRHQNQDILWLPREYRGVCTASHGNWLAIGQASGAVSVFGL